MPSRSSTAPAPRRKRRVAEPRTAAPFKKPSQALKGGRQPWAHRGGDGARLAWAVGLGWRVQWLASGAASLAALLAARRLVPHARETLPPAAEPGRSSACLTVLVLAYGLFGFGYVITATFISTIARATPAESLVWVAVGLSAAPSVAAWVAIGQRIGNEASFALACVIEAAGVVLSVLSVGLAGLLVSAVLLGGTMMGLVALGLIEARRLTRGDPRRGLALMTATFGLGQMIGPSFAGLLYDFAGSFRLPSLTAAAALLVVALLVACRDRAGHWNHECVDVRCGSKAAVALSLSYVRSSPYERTFTR